MATRRPDETHGRDADARTAADIQPAPAETRIPVRQSGGNTNSLWIVGAILLLILVVAILLMGLP